MVSEETKQPECDEVINSNPEAKHDEVEECTCDKAETDSTDTIVEEVVSDEERAASDKIDSKTMKRRSERKERKNKQDEVIDELNDKVRRQMAEFENFRKRSEKEKSQMFEIGARSVIEKILPIVDNLERGLAAVTTDKEDSFIDGMDKVYKQFLQILEETGVKPIDAVGNEFDPNLHNAVMHVEDEDIEDNLVVEEYQKGYKYHDVVVRHSMVKVAN